ncbi:solute carrier family 22 member 5 isoform X2 [Glossina fuscipes]|uniref:Solute carrier family 22 member 5 isoform X2 n=1 Tax=Glossina fuscipes TaxID=7396 RepID=A0A8U0WKF9_9MUSC|nr:solute carrier family 22 member 5 isoform X2 [Glossina fuscipes]
MNMKSANSYDNIKCNIEQQQFVDPGECDDPFQIVMEKAGNHGRFQLIYNLIFVSALAMAGAMMYMNIILALNIPEHWCTVPGREKTNFTLAEWRRLTLPTHKDNRDTETYSSCEMFDANFTEIDDWQNWNLTSAQTKVTGCRYGWSYDQTWYEKTIPTQENWICAKDLFVTNVFVVARITEVVGSFLLGQMGDIRDRSTIAIYQSFGWSIGTTLMPLLFWWLRDWQPFMWCTTIPTALILLFSKYVIESPRWLISKQRFADAIIQFKKIAKINGRTFTMSEKELIQIFSTAHAETTYGIASLFSGWRLARNTIIMGFSWCVVAVSYFTLVLFSSRMAGNPFLNFLLQSIVEIPAYMVGKYLGDTYGRRFTNCISFLISFLTCIPVIILATDVQYEHVIMGLAAFIKFLNAVTFFTASLQGMEIYPTCMRQTGIALGTILANAIGIVAPYLVYLGTTVDIRSPYYILGTLFLFGAIGAAFLPETLHKKLPDTMEEARQFGKQEKFFSLPKAPLKVTAESKRVGADAVRDDAATKKLNQTKYAP